MRVDPFQSQRTTIVPAGTCMLHGSFVGRSCPVCTTVGSVPLNQPFGNATAGQIGEQELER